MSEAYWSERRERSLQAVPHDEEEALAYDFDATQSQEAEPVLLGRAASNRFNRRFPKDKEADQSTSLSKKGRNKIKLSEASPANRVAQASLPLEPDVDDDGEQQDNTTADGVQAGRAILSMLRTQAPARAASCGHKDPQPLSTDEFQLWRMQAREDAEIGADIRNEETFGEDATSGGWSFEENLAANQQLLASHRHMNAWEASAQTKHLRWQFDRYTAALKVIVQYVHVEPPCLKSALAYVVELGWDTIQWKGGYTALHLAAEFGAVKVMPLLVALGADVDCVDSKGRSPRDVAKTKNEAGASKILKDLRRYQEVLGFRHEGDDSTPNTPESSIEPEPEQDPGHLRKARTPKTLPPIQEQMQAVGRLHAALADMVKLLQLPHVCFNAVMYTATTGDSIISGYGWFSSSIHVVVRCGRDDIIPMLVKLGAKMDAKDHMGMTARELATSWQSWSCAWMLQKLEIGESDEAGNEKIDIQTDLSKDKEAGAIPRTPPPGCWAQLRPRVSTKKAMSNFVD